jgi:outer membrane protein TolC
MLNTRLTLLGRGSEASDVSSTFERSLVSAGIRMELPLVDGGERRARVRRAEIDLEKSQLNQESVERRIVREIRDAVRTVSEAERQIELGREELEVAERTYDVERSRFELGLADSQELLQAQTALTQARLDGLREAIDYQRALAGLRVATMADLAELSEPGE